MNSSNKKNNLFDRVLFIIISVLLIVIVLLVLYLFTISPKNKQSTPELSKDTTAVPLITSAKTFTNTSSDWKTPDISSSLKILSAIQIDTTLSATFSAKVPPNSSAGFTFSNGLEEKDPNCRKISFYYYLKTQQWILKYQAGKKIRYTGIAPLLNNKISGTFSFYFAPNGKSVIVTLPNKAKKVIYFSTSLYDITNQMYIKALTGPGATLIISSLEYKAVKPY